MKYLFFVLASLFLTQLAVAATDPAQFTSGDEAYDGGTDTIGTASSGTGGNGLSTPQGNIVSIYDSSVPGSVAPATRAKQSSSPMAKCEASGTPKPVCICLTDPKYSDANTQGLCLRAAQDPSLLQLENSIRATNDYTRRFGRNSGSSGTSDKETSAAGGATFVDQLANQIASEILGGSPTGYASPQAQQSPDAQMNLLMQLLMAGTNGDSSLPTGY